MLCVHLPKALRLPIALQSQGSRGRGDCSGIPAGGRWLYKLLLGLGLESHFEMRSSFWINTLAGHSARKMVGRVHSCAVGNFLFVW